MTLAAQRGLEGQQELVAQGTGAVPQPDRRGHAPCPAPPCPGPCAGPSGYGGGARFCPLGRGVCVTLAVGSRVFNGTDEHGLPSGRARLCAQHLWRHSE